MADPRQPPNRSPFWHRWLGDGTGGRVRGRPPSSNGASSFHLRWSGLPTGTALVSVAATLEVVTAPSVADLHFWALQASFLERGRSVGAGHLGLQWHPGHPGGRAVNWGGYRRGGGELDGSVSALSSATTNANTRDLAWDQRRPHRLAITPGSSNGAWRGTVDGVAVRDLYAGGSLLAEVVVWSEVFAACDAPSTVVRWSELVAVTADGDEVAPDRVVVSYQAHADGGCANTDVVPDGDGFLQVTATARTTPAGATLTVARR